MRISHPNLDRPAACHTTWRASFLPYSYTITEPCSHSSLVLQAVSWQKLIKKNVAQLEERLDAEISWQKMAEMNVAETQVDVVASAWKNAEAGYVLRRALGGALCRLQERNRAPGRARGTGGERRRNRSIASGRGMSGQWCTSGGVHVTGAVALSVTPSDRSGE